MITAIEQAVLEDQLNELMQAFHDGCRIQAWHLTGPYPEGKWEDVSTDGEPTWKCPVHLYRIHPEDLEKAYGF